MKTTLIAAALLLTLGACTTTSDTLPTADSTVTGVATAGPNCPVMQDPPDPDCADRPVFGATLYVLDESGIRVAEVVTDGVGAFEVTVPAGRYTLEPQPFEGLLGTAETQQFIAGPDQVVDLSVVYDTGIR
jgi:hypothetical protein